MTVDEMKKYKIKKTCYLYSKKCNQNLENFYKGRDHCH